MSNRITFRERTPGVAVSGGGTPPAVSISEPRVKYVKGWHTTDGTDPGDGSAVECGEGTAYPLEVTVDQLAEIFYRVKDATWSGYLDYSGGAVFSVEVARPVDPTEQYHTRGYRDAAGDPLTDEREMWAATTVGGHGF